MTNYFTIVAFISGLSLVSNLQANENWSVQVAEDPISKSNTCLMISKTYTIDDGQTKTPVQLIFNGAKILAKTKSDIDTSYPGLGLKIDTDKHFTISRIHKNTIAVFANADDAIHQQFIKGKNAVLALGFWPTWPKSHTRKIKFSLIGYTKTYEAFKKCTQNEI